MGKGEFHLRPDPCNNAKQKGLYDSTVIIIWSDHGEALMEHGKWGHGDLYDDVIRVPLLIRIPSVEGNGRSIRSVVQGIDLAPAILELAGYPSAIRMDGVSFLDLLESDDRDDYAFSIRVRARNRLFSIRDRRYHFIWNGASDESSFFDLETDPEEMNNLFPSGLEAETRLQKDLMQWIEAYEQVRAESAPGEPILDEGMRRKLRSLGYLQ